MADSVLVSMQGIIMADGLANAYLRAPAAAMWGMGQVPKLVYDLSSVAFVISVLLTMVVTPIALITAVQNVWAIKSIGPARKTLSATFILLLWPLPVVIAAIVLAAIWSVLGLLVVGFIWLLPPAYIIWALVYGLSGSAEWRTEQRRDAPREPPEDITFTELGLALFVAVLSACTTAPLVAALSLLKSPLVFISVTARATFNIAKFLAECVKEVWWTAVLFLPALAIAFTGTVLFVAAATAFSVLVKVLGAVLWPGYVACGMLRTLGSRRQARGCGTILYQAAQAAYQVLWFSDIVSNASILMRTSLAREAIEELVSIAAGHQVELSAEVRRVSWLPAVVIGALRTEGGEWTVDFAHIARELKMDERVLEQMWTSFFQQMNHVGRQMLDRGLLTPEYVEETPPALLIGLPAVVLLKAIERSPAGQKVLILADGGAKVTAESRPRGTEFVEMAWVHLMEAKAAHDDAEQRGALDRSAAAALETYLLAGGAPSDELPPQLASGVAATVGGDDDGLSPSLAAIYRPLYAIVYKMAQQQVYKQHFAKQVYESLCEYKPRGR